MIVLPPLLQLQLIQTTLFLPITVESLLTDTLNKEHCIKYISTMDKTKSPNFNSPINIMQLEYLDRGHLYIVDKPLELILVPKCPLFGDSTVCHFTIW